MGRRKHGLTSEKGSVTTTKEGLNQAYRPEMAAKTKSAPNVEHFCLCNSIVVRERGLEPPRPKTLVPETSASTNSATRAY